MKEEYSTFDHNKSSIAETDIASVEEFKEAFEKELVDKNFLVALTNIALKKIRYFFYKDEIDGISAEDLIQNIIVKFLTGKRVWYAKNARSVKEQLIMAIVSEVKNKFDAEFKKVEEVDAQGNKSINFNKKHIIESLYDDKGEVKEYLIKRDSNLENFDFEKDSVNSLFKLEIKQVKEILNDDIDAYFVFEEIIKCGKDNKQIAQNLGLEVKEVEAAKKRIKRKTEQIFYKN